MDLQKLLAKVPKIEGFDSKSNETMVAPYAFIREGEDKLVISTENGDMAADYYGEFRGGIPWINPILEAFAKENGGFWEWENAGAIVFVEN